MNKSVVAVMVLDIEELDNLVISAAYNSLTGFNKIGKGCMAYEPFKELGLIEENGKAISEELEYSLSYVIHKKVEEGTFN